MGIITYVVGGIWNWMFEDFGDNVKSAVNVPVEMIREKWDDAQVSRHNDELKKKHEKASKMADEVRAKYGKQNKQ